jgi:zinc/manganese transport system ATP-binding protein
MTTAGSATPAVTCDRVAIARGGRTLWSGGTFEIAAGSMVGVIGPNGSGKTSLLELLLGLVEPSEGAVSVLGAAPSRGSSRIGYVPQNYTSAVGDAVRCRDLVALSLTGTTWGLRRRDPSWDGAVDAALASVGASDLASSRFARVSGGQQQRVAVAQALVNQPDLLLLDEPLANLDVRNQHDIVHLLSDLARARGITVVIVAHDLNPLLAALDGAVYLLDGTARYGAIDTVVDPGLLSSLYGTAMKVVRTPDGDLFTRTA